jgi:hypothetical protein
MEFRPSSALLLMIIIAGAIAIRIMVRRKHEPRNNHELRKKSLKQLITWILFAVGAIFFIWLELT